MSDKVVRTIRTPHTKQRPYFSMSRATAQDETLSWEARGLLAYLLSKPDDWQVKVKDLEQNCGENKVYRILRELIDARYVKRERLRKQDGVLAGIEYRVYEQPFDEKPDVVKPNMDKPRVENRDAYILESEQSIEKNKVESSSTAAVYRAYENMTGTIPPSMVVKLETALEDYPAEWLLDAFQIAVEQNKRSWSYAVAILTRWKRDGKDNGRKEQSPQPAPVVSNPNDEFLERPSIYGGYVQEKRS